MKKILNKIHKFINIIIKYIKLIIKEYIPILFQVLVEDKKVKRILSEMGVNNAKIYNLKGWHFKYRYYIGFMNQNKVFIKISTKRNWIKHEYEINKYIEKNSDFLNDHKVKIFKYDKISKFEILIEEFIDVKKLNEISIDNEIQNFSQVLICMVEEFQRIGLFYIDFYEGNIFVDKNLNIKIFDFGFSIIKKQGINFMDNLHDVKLIYKNINSENRLDVGIIDDAYSVFEILKKIDSDFINNCTDEYKRLLELQGKEVFYLGDYYENK